MEKVAVAGTHAGKGRKSSLGAMTVFALAACAACPALQAQEASPAEVLVAEARTEQSTMKVQVQTSALPRLEAQDTGFQAPRVDLSFTPANTAGLGAVFGMSGFSGNAQAVGLQPQRTNVDFGLRWSHKLQSQRQIDVTAWRRMNVADDAYTLLQMRQPVYGARVEMKLTPAKPFALDRGLIGMQLESGARISIRRKNGGPMIYYRTSF